MGGRRGWAGGPGAGGGQTALRPSPVLGGQAEEFLGDWRRETPFFFSKTRSDFTLEFFGGALKNRKIEKLDF